MVWPALIAAGAALAGGALSNKANRKEAAANREMQYDFAQNGIAMRVADAKRSGIHPLYALGASTPSASPISVGDSMGPALASAGQDISRAMYATRDAQDRKTAELNAAAAQDRAEKREDLKLASQLKNDEVQRQYYASQTARINQQANPPMAPAVTSGSKSGTRIVPMVSGKKSGAVTYEPAKITSRDTRDSSSTAGNSPAWSAVEMFPGYPHVYVPSQSYSEQLEGMGEVGGFLFGTLPAFGKTGYEWLKKGIRKFEGRSDRPTTPADRRSSGRVRY